MVLISRGKKCCQALLKVGVVLNLFGIKCRAIDLRIKDGRLLGVSVFQYLPQNRNILQYEIFEILSNQDKYSYKNGAAMFKAQSNSNTPENSNKNRYSRLNFESLNTIMKSLGISSKMFKCIVEILTAITMFTNLHFESKKASKNSTVSNAESYPSSISELRKISQIFGVQESELKTLLTTSLTHFGRETLSISLNPQKCQMFSNNIAVFLFNLLGNYIITHINNKISLSFNENDESIKKILLISIHTTNDNNSDSQLDTLLKKSAADIILSGVCEKLINHYEIAMNDCSVPHYSLENIFSDSVLKINDAFKLLKIRGIEQNHKSCNFTGTEVKVKGFRWEFKVSHFGGKEESSYDTKNFMEDNFINLTELQRISQFFRRATGPNQKLLSKLLSVISVIDKSKKEPNLDGKLSSFRTEQLCENLQQLKRQAGLILEDKKRCQLWMLLIISPYRLDSVNMAINNLKLLFKLVDPICYRFSINSFINRYAIQLNSLANVRTIGESHNDNMEVCKQFVQYCHDTNNDNGIKLKSCLSKTAIYLDSNCFNFLELKLEFNDKSSSPTIRQTDLNNYQPRRNQIIPEKHEAITEWVNDIICDESQSNTNIEQSTNEFTASGTSPLYSSKVKNQAPLKEQMGPERARWVCCTWCLTWWIPTFILRVSSRRMRNADVRMAWREKVALCIIIFLLCAILMFLIVGLGRVICPRLPVISPFEIAGSDINRKPTAYAYGRAYDLSEIIESHHEAYGIDKFNFAPFVGGDVSELFYKNQMFSTYCPGLPEPQPGWDNLGSRHKADNTYFAHRSPDPITGLQKLYLEYMNRYAIKRVV